MTGKEKTAREFGRILAAGGGPPSLEERLVGQRQAVIEMVVERPRTDRRNARMRGAVAVAVLSAAAAALVLYFAIAPSADSDIPFFVGASKVQEKEGRFLSTGPKENTIVHFDGGSQFDFGEFSEARVVKASGREVTIDLTQGKVRANVNPASRRGWTVRAGPYAVVVKGTIFAVSWDNASAILSVSVDRGRVVVLGPGLDIEGVPLAAGNSLKADANAGRITFERTNKEEALIAELANDGEPSLPSEIASVKRAKKNKSEVKVQPSTAKSKSSLVVCRQLYGEKDYAGALESAEKSGLLDAGKSRNLAQDDLWMFANAARYARRVNLANDLFAAYRSRFSGTPRAHTAAFLLGKSAMGLRDLGAAKKWFGLYLAETPNGPLAEEALGHLIDIHANMGNKPRAQQLARDYLSKYSGGYFSKQAHQVLKN